MAAKTKSKPSTAKTKKEPDKVVLYLLISDEQQQALRVLTFMRQTTTAKLVREAIDLYLATKGPSAEDVEAFVKLVRDSVRRSDLGRSR